jgi:hypothetical protein
MTQREINSTIDELFDEFIKADGDINKMDVYQPPKKNETDFSDDITNKTHFSDDSLTLDMSNSFSGDLLNNYIEYFKKKNNKPKQFTLLDGIDKCDPYSTNMPLEEIYYEMTTFLENEKSNPELCAVIPYEELSKKMTTMDELYCLLINGKPFCVSHSVFALLIELTNIKNENKNKKITNVYDIVNLK